MTRLVMRQLMGMLVTSLLLLGSGAGNAAEQEGGHGDPYDWQHWKAGNSVANTASLQRGARNFVNYCLGCHSLKYLRYERLAKDLGIPDAELRRSLIPTGDKPTDYMLSNFPHADGEAFFGRVPPDLSLIGRAKGPDYVYQFLKTFYVDESKPTGTNNLALDGAAMPAVLSDLEGVKRAVFHEGGDEAGGHGGGKRLAGFERVSPGHLTDEQFDEFVRDTVNFLDYAGEPTQLKRASLGVWVVFFMLVFTWFSWLLKREYWKDVH